MCSVHVIANKTAYATVENVCGISLNHFTDIIIVDKECE
jgi:hypothetical protein